MVEANQEATVYMKHFDIFVCAMVEEDSLGVLSLQVLCVKLGDSCSSKSSGSTIIDPKTESHLSAHHQLLARMVTNVSSRMEATARWSDGISCQHLHVMMPQLLQKHWD